MIRLLDLPASTSGSGLRSSRSSRVSRSSRGPRTKRPRVMFLDSFRWSLSRGSSGGGDCAVEGSFCPAASAVGSLTAPGEPTGDADADLAEKLHAEPYPRVRYFMTVSVGNADLSVFRSPSGSDVPFLLSGVFS